MANLDFFRDASIQEPEFFDEGPPVRHLAPTVSTLTSSINTSAIDGWRQGVELTQQKHWDAGTAKIWAGEAGHMPKRNRYGMGDVFRMTPPFEELDYFDPATFLRAQDELFNVTFTYPIVTNDNNQSENYLLDGIVEPFTIRARASFFSIDIPIESHDTKGAVMAGNTDSINASDQVLTVDYFSISQIKGYIDLIDMMGNQPLNGFFHVEKVRLLPFIDERLIVTPVPNLPADFTAAVSLMSGSFDYISPHQRSATSGWVYDGVQGIGTDSIAFGGLTY